MLTLMKKKENENDENKTKIKENLNKQNLLNSLDNNLKTLFDLIESRGLKQK